jgi:hypothetical protein
MSAPFWRLDQTPTFVRRTAATRGGGQKEAIALPTGSNFRTGNNLQPAQGLGRCRKVPESYLHPVCPADFAARWQELPINKN